MNVSTKRAIIGVPFARGVGQSTFLSAYVEWARQQVSSRIAILESKDGNHTLRSALPDYWAIGVTVSDIEWPGISGADVASAMTEALAYSETADIVVVDDHSAAEYLPGWHQVEEIRRCSDFGYELTLVILLDEQECDFERALGLVQSLGRRADVLCVRVEKVSRCVALDRWDVGELKRRARSLSVISFPRMPLSLAGFTCGTGTGIPRTVVQALQQDRNILIQNQARTYWGRLAEQFHACRTVLLPRLDRTL